QLPFDVIDRLADRLDLVGLVIRDGDVELLLQVHHHLDDVERIGTEVLSEGGLAGDLFGADAEVLADTGTDAFFSRGLHNTILPGWARLLSVGAPHRARWLGRLGNGERPAPAGCPGPRPWAGKRQDGGKPSPLRVMYHSGCIPGKVSCR